MNMMNEDMRWIAPFRELIERALAGGGNDDYQL